MHEKDTGVIEMDYEKKYKEAMEDASYWIKEKPECKELLQSLFPELTESEDERISRAIGNMLPFIPDEAYTVNGVTKEGVWNWLKKQKEPRFTKRNALFDKSVANCDPAVMRKVSDEVDEMLQKEQKQPHHLANSYSVVSPKEAEEEITKFMLENSLNPEQKPVEWKPTEEHFNYLAKAIMTLGEKGDCKTAGVLSEIRKGLKCNFPDWKMSSDYPEEGCNVSLNGEVKKLQEWNEEDEAMRLEAIRVLVSGCERYRRESGCLPAWHVTIDWLKSLRPQPKVEWGEEDEKMYHCISDSLCLLRKMYEYSEDRVKDYNMMLEWYRHRLKSLRPQPQHRDTYYDIIHNILDMLKGMDFMKITPEHRVSLLNDIRVKCKNADECATILDEPHWKPSEEQMKALKKVAYNIVGTGTETDIYLVQLYEQLKKL